MDNNISEVLFSVIRAAFDLPVVSVDINADGFKALEIIAHKQKIVPIITAGLKKLGYSEHISKSLFAEESKSVYDYTQRMVSLAEITDALESSSIPYIPLKGSVIRELYPQPEMRTSSDIDVLIHLEDLDKAIRVLESKTSFKYYKKERHDAHFVNQYVHLELHFSLEYSVEKISDALSNPWDNTISSEKPYRYVFTPEYNMFYIVSHAAKHFIQSGGIGIRPLLDIYVLRTHTDFDNNKVKLFCESAGILGFYNSCCKLIDVWFNGDVHDENSRLFEELVLSGCVFGSQHLMIVSKKRRDSGKKYIRGRIFKTSEELGNYYPKCRKYPILVPYYQVVRWTKVFRLNKTKAYFSEFKQANSIDKTEVEKYDKLLKAMGL
jgi:predicted nucleotidyltransferase